jgi:hypothetical protein
MYHRYQNVSGLRMQESTQFNKLSKMDSLDMRRHENKNGLKMQEEKPKSRRARQYTRVAFRFTSTNKGLDAAGAKPPLAFGKCRAGLVVATVRHVGQSCHSKTRFVRPPSSG